MSTDNQTDDFFGYDDSDENWLVKPIEAFGIADVEIPWLSFLDTEVPDVVIF